MKVFEYNPAEVQILPEFRTRNGEPDQDKVSAFALQMLERREAGLTHQIQPGVVRMVEGSDIPVLMIGEHRLLAELSLNENLPEGMEPYTFHATIVREDDKQAVRTAIAENEWRVATTVFDRAKAMQMLIDLGDTQEEIGKQYGLSASTVSETLRLGKLAKKYQKMVLDGTMSEEAAYVFARYNKQPELLTELVDFSLERRQELDDIAARAEEAAAAELAAIEEAEAEKQAAKGAKADAKAGGKPAGKKESKASSAESKQAFEAAKKAAKKKVAGKKATKGKVTAEDAKAAVKAKGVSKQPDRGPKGRTKAEFTTALNGLFGENSTDTPEPIAYLAGRIERFLDNELEERGLKAAFVKCCLPAFE